MYVSPLALNPRYSPLMGGRASDDVAKGIRREPELRYDSIYIPRNMQPLVLLRYIGLDDISIYFHLTATGAFLMPNVDMHIPILPDI